MTDPNDPRLAVARRIKRALLAEGDVSVNGEVETRRGRQLVRGDVVTVDLPTGPDSVQVD